MLNFPLLSTSPTWLPGFPELWLLFEVSCLPLNLKVLQKTSETKSFSWMASSSDTDQSVSFMHERGATGNTLTGEARLVYSLLLGLGCLCLTCCQDNCSVKTGPLTFLAACPESSAFCLAMYFSVPGEGAGNSYCIRVAEEVHHTVRAENH